MDRPASASSPAEIMTINQPNQPLMTQLADMVRQYDPDRYWLWLTVPYLLRLPVISLFALNVELSRVADVTHDPMMGVIRLQWWRDQIGSFSGTSNQTYLVVPLRGLEIGGGLQSEYWAESLDILVRGRLYEINRPIVTYNDWLTYIDQTSGQLMYLTTKLLLGSAASNQLCQFARLWGRFYGILGIIRSIPRHAQLGRCYLPLEILADYQITEDNIANLQFRTQLAHICRKLLKPMQYWLQNSDAGAIMSAGVDKVKFMRAFIALTLHDLGQLTKADYQPFAKILAPSALPRIWKIMVA